MASEYDVKVRIEPVPQRFARWVSRVDGASVDLQELSRAQIGLVAVDVRNRPVVLFEGDWALRSAERFHPELVFAETAVGVVVRDA
jgi:peptide chain release factor 3